MTSMNARCLKQIYKMAASTEIAVADLNVNQNNNNTDDDWHVCTCDTGDEVCLFRRKKMKAGAGSKQVKGKPDKGIPTSVLDDYIQSETEMRVHGICHYKMAEFKQMHVDTLQDFLKEKAENERLRVDVDYTAADLVKWKATCDDLKQQLEATKVAKRRRRQAKKHRKIDRPFSSSRDSDGQDDHDNTDSGVLETQTSGSGDHVNELTAILDGIDIES